MNFFPLFSEQLGVSSLFLLSLLVTSLRRYEVLAPSRARGQLTRRFSYLGLYFFSCRLRSRIARSRALLSQFALLLCLGHFPGRPVLLNSRARPVVARFNLCGP